MQTLNDYRGKYGTVVTDGRTSLMLIRPCAGMRAPGFNMGDECQALPVVCLATGETRFEFVGTEVGLLKVAA